MNIYAIYDMPVWLFGICCIGLFVLFGVIGLALTRKWIYETFRISASSDQTINGFFAGIGVLFGILVGLVAIASWESYEKAADIASAEAATIASLYRDVSILKQPMKGELQENLRRYLHDVIHVAWPAHKQGLNKGDGLIILTELHGMLEKYKASTPEQQIFLAEAVSKFNELIQARRARQDAIKVGIPAPFWVAILAGCALSILISFFFHCPTPLTHYIMVSFYSAFLGIVVWLIASVDNPFRGEVAISSAAYEAVYEKLDLRDPAYLKPKP